MTKTVCDICGEEMSTTNHVDNIENLNFCISSHGKIWDICNKCRVSLAEWMLICKEKGENKQTDVSVNPYDMKYIRCEKGEYLWH